MEDFPVVSEMQLNPDVNIHLQGTQVFTPKKEKKQIILSLQRLSPLLQQIMKQHIWDSATLCEYTNITFVNAPTPMYLRSMQSMTP